MALFQISNDKITVQVDSMGAELKSLKRVADAREYLWQGDSAYWGRTSPVLFPIVGALKNGRYRIGEKEYPLGQHGFARDMEFQLKSQVASEIWFSLHSDEKTLAVYPYPFLLEIGYELTGSTVIVKWRVSNPEEEPIWFSIGGHPGFLCPIDPGQTRPSIGFPLMKRSRSSPPVSGTGFWARIKRLTDCVMACCPSRQSFLMKMLWSSRTIRRTAWRL